MIPITASDEHGVGSRRQGRVRNNLSIPVAKHPSPSPTPRYCLPVPAAAAGCASSRSSAAGTRHDRLPPSASGRTAHEPPRRTVRTGSTVAPWPRRQRGCLRRRREPQSPPTRRLRTPSSSRRHPSGTLRRPPAAASTDRPPHSPRSAADDIPIAASFLASTNAADRGFLP
jgi:hypothetical protein